MIDIYGKCEICGQTLNDGHTCHIPPHRITCTEFKVKNATDISQLYKSCLERNLERLMVDVQKLEIDKNYHPEKTAGYLSCKCDVLDIILNNLSEISELFNQQK